MEKLTSSMHRFSGVLGPMIGDMSIFTRNLKNNRVLEKILCCSVKRNTYLHPIYNKITYVFASKRESKLFLSNILFSVEIVSSDWYACRRVSTGKLIEKVVAVNPSK